jgi:hypothetical protein
MADDRSSGLYPIEYDECQEAWYVTLPEEAPRIPLDRATLDHLVTCYNEIHRGTALTLMERRAMLELGQERRELEAAVRSLYDRMDGPEEAALAAPGRFGGGFARLMAWLRRRTPRRGADGASAFRA